MDTHNWRAIQFEAERPRLRAMAYRMLGSLAEAEDAIQETWLNLSRSDMSVISNLGGWLTTVVGRVCLNMLHARTLRREDSLEAFVINPLANRESGIDPEEEAELTDLVGLALLVVLDTLAPAERIAFVLHDIFSVPFEEIAPLVDRSPTATRQLASRARRRVRGSDMMKDADLPVSRDVINAFLTASREGSFDALLAVLDPNVALRSDHVLVSRGAAREISGAQAVAQALRAAMHLLRRTRSAQPLLVDGGIGIVLAPRKGPLFLLRFTVVEGKIVTINAMADSAKMHQMHLAIISG